MQLKLRMIDPSEFKSAALTGFSGLVTATSIGAWLALHPLATWTAQGLITIGLTVLSYFVQRWLRRNFPQEPAPQEQAEQAIKAAKAAVDWFKYLRPVARPLFDLIRDAIARLRRRKES